MSPGMLSQPHVEVRSLTMAYGDLVIQQDLNFRINHGDIFIIMGGSGCGKSTLLRHLVGLQAPVAGDVLFDGISFWGGEEAVREELMRRTGILYQSGALWSSLTLAENVALPMREYTDLAAGEIAELVSLKLALVGLGGFETYYPAEISGGMRDGVVTRSNALALMRAVGLDVV